MDPERPPSLIALDWGTSSLRGWLLDPAGRVLERREAALGIQAVSGGDFAAAFETFCSPWLAIRPDLPAIASGMIGSRQGWREAPYLETPAGLDAVAAGLLGFEAGGRHFHIVPGLLARPPGQPPDVIRGEETQVFGALGQAAEGARLFVLPGTHSKWAATQSSTIAGFRTYLTGELYAVLRQHSILGRLCEEPADPDAAGPLAALDDGLARGLADPGALGHLLFSVRSEGLLGLRAPAQLPGYLSGLLIGAEVGDALRSFGSHSPCVIAAPALASRYLRAFRLAGVEASAAAGEPALDGLSAIARRAGLLG
jgi:2-dehydro-3-deoxygalactonokinase